VNINASGLIVGNVYTAVAKVKKVIGLDEVSIKAGTGVSTSTVYPATLKRSNVDAYHLISYPFTATAATVAVKITGVLSAGSTSGIYLIDSADILKGYNNFDVSLYN
jgi:hypothetical protein